MTSLLRKNFQNSLTKEGNIKEINILDEYIIINCISIYYEDIVSIKDIKEAGFFKNRFEFEFTIVKKDGTSQIYRVCEGLYKFKQTNNSGNLIVKTIEKAMEEYKNNPQYKENIERLKSFDENHPFLTKFKEKFKTSFTEFMDSFICLGEVALDKPVALGVENYNKKTLYYNDKYFWFDCSFFIKLAEDVYYYFDNKPTMKFISMLDSLDRGFNNQWKDIHDISKIKYIEEYKTKNTIMRKPASNFELGVIESIYGTAAAMKEASKPFIEQHDMICYKVIFDENYTGPEVYFSKYSVEKDANLNEFVNMFTKEIYNKRISKTKKEEKKKQSKVNKTDKTSTSIPDEIRKYKQLLDDGIITNDEFEAKKKELLKL